MKIPSGTCGTKESRNKSYTMCACGAGDMHAHKHISKHTCTSGPTHLKMYCAKLSMQKKTTLCQRHIIKETNLSSKILGSGRIKVSFYPNLNLVSFYTYMMICSYRIVYHQILPSLCALTRWWALRGPAS